jgi:hypothetical protein
MMLYFQHDNTREVVYPRALDDDWHVSFYPLCSPRRRRCPQERSSFNLKKVIDVGLI